MYGFLLVFFSNFVPKTHRFEIFDSETIEVSPSVGSAVCTSTGEVGRGAI